MDRVLTLSDSQLVHDVTRIDSCSDIKLVVISLRVPVLKRLKEPLINHFVICLSVFRRNA